MGNSGASLFPGGIIDTGDSGRKGCVDMPLFDEGTPGAVLMIRPIGTRGSGRSTCDLREIS